MTRTNSNIANSSFRTCEGVGQFIVISGQYDQFYFSGKVCNASNFKDCDTIAPAN